MNIKAQDYIKTHVLFHKMNGNGLLFLVDAGLGGKRWPKMNALHPVILCQAKVFTSPTDHLCAYRNILCS